MSVMIVFYVTSTNSAMCKFCHKLHPWVKRWHLPVSMTLKLQIIHLQGHMNVFNELFVNPSCWFSRNSLLKHNKQSKSICNLAGFDQIQAGAQLFRWGKKTKKSLNTTNPTAEITTPAFQILRILASHTKKKLSKQLAVCVIGYPRKWRTSKWLTHGLTDTRFNGQLMHLCGKVRAHLCPRSRTAICNNWVFINNAQCFRVGVTLTFRPHASWRLNWATSHTRHSPRLLSAAAHKLH